MTFLLTHITERGTAKKCLKAEGLHQRHRTVKETDANKTKKAKPITTDKTVRVAV